MKIFSLLFIPCSLCCVYKLNITYEFLATRTIIKDQEDYETIFSDDYNEFCQSKYCFAAVYDGENNTKYDLLINEQSDCKNMPNCLSFNKSEYLYTIAFLQELECTNSSDILENLDYVPQCSEKFNSFTRANGKNWCFQVNQFTSNRSEAESYCSTNYNATLNGFESEEERQILSEYLPSLSSNVENRSHFMHLGAQRLCDSESCDKDEFHMTWKSSIISRIDNIGLLDNYDGSGNCLKMNKDELDDFGCNNLINYVSCGKYAE